MKHVFAGAAMIAAMALGGCEGMAPGGYGDMPEDGQIAAAQAAIPQLPPMPDVSGPSGIPRPPSMPAPKPPSTTFPATPAPPTQTTGGPSQMQKPPTAPAPTGQTTGGPSQMPKPPAAPAPPPAPKVAICQSPQVMLRTEITGAMEMKCGQPPSAPPASLKCTSPEQITYLTRNGVSSFACMK